MTLGSSTHTHHLAKPAAHQWVLATSTKVILEGFDSGDCTIWNEMGNSRQGKQSTVDWNETIQTNTHTHTCVWLLASRMFIFARAHISLYIGMMRTLRHKTFHKHNQTQTLTLPVKQHAACLSHQRSRTDGQEKIKTRVCETHSTHFWLIARRHWCIWDVRK